MLFVFDTLILLVCMGDVHLNHFTGNSDTGGGVES